MRKLFCIIALLSFAVPVLAQQDSSVPDPQNPEGGDLETPPSWIVRLDQPGDEVRIGSEQDSVDIWFVNMTPGWHITTGPAGIFYHPELDASGSYTARTVLHLFDPGEHHEAYGLFFGGSSLTDDDIEYDYFVIRNSGEYLIKRRDGPETETIRGWTEHPAIRTYESGMESVANDLQVSVDDDEVIFSINGEEVDRLPADQVRTDGTVGLRVNHRLNLHVEDLSVTDY